MTRDEAVEIATHYGRTNNYWLGEVETATFLLRAPPVRATDEWAVVFQNKMMPGSSLIITVDPRTRTAAIFVP